MRRLAALPVAALILAGCGSATMESGDDLTPFQRWCAEQTPDRCVEGFFLLYWEPDQERCVIETDADDHLFLCFVDPQDSDPPVTTIPDPESIADEERRAEIRRAELLADRPEWEPELLALLQTTHPEDQATITLVPPEPLALDAADALVARLGGTFEQAWRTDYVCLSGWLQQSRPSRIAYRDGVERAERSRREAEESEVAMEGFHFLRDTWARWELEARALEEPGVQIEALTATLPTSSIQAALVDPGLRFAWIGTAGEALMGLSEPPAPECPE